MSGGPRLVAHAQWTSVLELPDAMGPKAEMATKHADATKTQRVTNWSGEPARVILKNRRVDPRGSDTAARRGA